MIPQGLFTQIALVLLSVGIVFTYVKPTYEKVSVNQDAIMQYREERQKVSAVNATLQQLMNKADAISEIDDRRLRTYMPDQVDGVAVQRDLLQIAEQADISLTSLSSEAQADTNRSSRRGNSASAEVDGVTGSARATLTPHVFQLGFTSDYATIKAFLALLQRNHYPLEVRELSITGASSNDLGQVVTSDELTVEMSIATYAFSIVNES